MTTPSQKRDKLQTLLDIEGYSDSISFMEMLISDSVNPGICTNSNCEYTTEVEPDCRNGYCEECGTQTVASALVLLDMI